MSIGSQLGGVGYTMESVYHLPALPPAVTYNDSPASVEINALGETHEASTDGKERGPSNRLMRDDAEIRCAEKGANGHNHCNALTHGEH